MFESIATLPAGHEPVEQIEARLTSGAGQLAAFLCRWLLDLAEFDRRGGWAEWGCRSTAHWLTFRCGESLGAAREYVKVAGRLGGLPHIRAAFSGGEVSFAQVRLLVRVASPETDASLLSIAQQATTSQLGSIVTGLQRVLAVEAAEAGEERHRKRSVRWWFDEDGFLNLSARLTPEDGAVLTRAIDAVSDELRRVRKGKVRQPWAICPRRPRTRPGSPTILGGRAVPTPWSPSPGWPWPTGPRRCGTAPRWSCT